jgi:hypothetical protein
VQEPPAGIEVLHRSERAFYAVPRFSSPFGVARTVRSQAVIDQRRSFSPRKATAGAENAGTPVPMRGERWAEYESGSVPSDRLRRSRHNEGVDDVMEGSGGQRPLPPATAIDRLELGDWITQYLERQTMRPPVSMTGSDPRLTPVWAGSSFGL